MDAPDVRTPAEVKNAVTENGACDDLVGKAEPTVVRPLPSLVAEMPLQQEVPFCSHSRSTTQQRQAAESPSKKQRVYMEEDRRFNVETERFRRIVEKRKAREEKLHVKRRKRRKSKDPRKHAAVSHSLPSPACCEDKSSMPLPDIHSGTRMRQPRRCKFYTRGELDLKSFDAELRYDLHLRSIAEASFVWRSRRTHHAVCRRESLPSLVSLERSCSTNCVEAASAHLNEDLEKKQKKLLEERCKKYVEMEDHRTAVKQAAMRREKERTEGLRKRLEQRERAVVLRLANRMMLGRRHIGADVASIGPIARENALDIQHTPLPPISESWRRKLPRQLQVEATAAPSLLFRSPEPSSCISQIKMVKRSASQQPI